MCKMLVNALLLVLPAIVYVGGVSENNIKISIGVFDDDEGVVHYVRNVKSYRPYVSYEIREIIPDEERINVWRLNDDQLKTLNQSDGPSGSDDVKTWGEICKEYDWRQVERILVPTIVKIIDGKQNTQFAYYYYFNSNNSSKTLDTIPPFHHKLEEKLSSTWIKRTKGELKIGRKINYNVSLHTSDGAWKAVSSINYTSKWGEDVTKTKELIITPKYPLTGRPVKPGQTYKMNITLHVQKVKFQIDYVAELIGSVVCSDSAKKELQSKNIKLLQREKKLPDRHDSTEIITVVFTSFVKQESTGLGYEPLQFMRKGKDNEHDLQCYTAVQESVSKWSIDYKRVYRPCPSYLLN